MAKIIIKLTHSVFALFAFSVIVLAALTISGTWFVSGQAGTVLTVTGYDGPTKNYTLAELQNLPSVSGYGGFFQQNQNQTNSGNWTGVSLYYLCNQTSGITPTCTVSVIGQGTSNFTYEMVANGNNFNLAYNTYNNVTGALQNQTQPVTVLLAYLVNGSALPSSMMPAPRLVIVGSEGLLMVGSGGRSITQVTITHSAPTPTPTPTATPTPTPAPTSTPTASPTPAATPTPVPTSSPTHTTAPTAIPTQSPTPTPTSPPSPSPTQQTTPQPTVEPSATQPPSQQLNDIYLIVAAVVIVIIIIAVALMFRKR